MNRDVAGFTEYMKAVLTFTGLDTLGKFEVVQKPPTGPEDEFVLHGSIPLPSFQRGDIIRNKIDAVNEKFQAALTNSPLVQEITGSLNKEIKDLKEKLDLQAKTIENLRKYEIHFNLEYNLKHGEPPFGKVPIAKL